MTRRDSPHRRGYRAYAGLDFIKAAFCPLAFKATLLKDHSLFSDFRGDKALGLLEAGSPLTYPRQFRYKDPAGNYKIGTQVITAPFGLAPKDFDLFLGLYTYLRQLDDMPADNELDLTADFLGRRCGFPVSSQKDYRRIRSRIFRFSYVKYTNSSFWNPELKSYDIRNFEFYSLAALSRVTASRRPITFHFSSAFLDIAQRAKFLRFDYDFYFTLSSPLRRFYLLANQMGWKNRDSVIFDVDDFAINQIGYQDDDPRRPRDGRKLRRQKIRRLLRDAEDRDLIRPCAGWDGYSTVASRGPLTGCTVLRWSRGPRLLRREDARPITLDESIENDALYDQLRALKDQEGKSVTPIVYQSWLDKYGRTHLQKHARIVLAQKEYRPDSFAKSAVAAFVDRLKNNYTPPDWYTDLQREERLAPFKETTPNQLSMEMYDTFFR